MRFTGRERFTSVADARKFAERFAGDLNVIVLVDFENDSVRTAMEVADALGDEGGGPTFLERKSVEPATLAVYQRA
jgi:hypothetical protein